MSKFDFLTEEQYQQLIENGRPENRDLNHAPVVRLFLPYTNCVWLLSEIDGSPELGYVSLTELSNLVNFPFKVITDKSFFGKYPMSVYCDAARVGEQTSIDDTLLKKYNDMFVDKRNKMKHRPPQPRL